MTHSDPTADKPQAVSAAGHLVPQANQRVFTGVLVVSGIVWISLAIMLCAGVSMLAVDYLRETILVTVLSGIVAAISLMPGLVNEWTTQPIRSTTDDKAKQTYLGPVFGGIILRLVATVALFVMCRYQFAESVNWIAALTIGWYVVLTGVEVALLARKLPKLDAISSMTPSVAAVLSASPLAPSAADIA